MVVTHATSVPIIPTAGPISVRDFGPGLFFWILVTGRMTARCNVESMCFTSRLGTPCSRLGRIIPGFNGEYDTSADSILSIQGTVDLSIDYLTAYDYAGVLIGLNNDSQGSAALVHALLHYAAKRSVRTLYTNPFDEVCRQLENSGVNPHALQFLRAFFNSASMAYSQRN